MEKNFESEVLERLAKIETKLDDYNSIKDRADEAYNLSKYNKKDIDEIKGKLQWITRTVAASIITIVIGAIVAFIKMSDSVKSFMKN